VTGATAGRADLHLHTTMSDGATTPAEMAEVLAASGLSVAAITDDDTVEGALGADRAALVDGTDGAGHGRRAGSGAGKGPRARGVAARKQTPAHP